MKYIDIHRTDGIYEYVVMSIHPSGILEDISISGMHWCPHVSTWNTQRVSELWESMGAVVLQSDVMNGLVDWS